MVNCRNCGKATSKPFAKVFCSKKCCGACHNKMRRTHANNHYGCVEIEHLKIIDYSDVEREDILKSLTENRDKADAREYY